MVSSTPSISVVIPVYNEADNIPPLIERLVLTLASMTDQWEIIFVNDGSTDQTQSVLEAYANLEPRVKLIEFRRNYGQTAALAAGIELATKELVVTLDGDLQNDPADIPAMVAELRRGGYDVVHGWRRQRQDGLLLRKLPSRVANWLIARVTKVAVHDLGCALRVMRREIAQELELYGQMHRFIPILAHWRGARSTELITHHYPRRFGRSKYGLERTIGVLLDLLTVKFILDYFSSPMRLFGRLALACMAVGILAALATLAMKVFQSVDMTGNPLLLLAVFSVMVAVQLLSLGFLGELCVRIYYAASEHRNFAIRRLVNFPHSIKVPRVSVDSQLAELPAPTGPSAGPSLRPQRQGADRALRVTSEADAMSTDAAATPATEAA